MEYNAKKLGVTSTMRMPISCLSMQTKIFLFLTLLMAILFLGTLNAEAASVYYVRAAATGANNGSDWSNAYTNLPNTLVRGATYYVADGGYNDHTFNDNASGTTIITIKKATDADHGTSTGWISSYGDGQAVFSYFAFTTGYYTIDGQVGGGPTSWNTGHGFAVSSTKGKRVIFNTGVSHVTISHTEVTNSDNTANGTNYGSLVYSYGDVTYISFSYCYIHHVYGCCIQGGYSGINNWTIEYSKVGDNTGDTNHSEIWSRMGADNFTWRYNYIYQWRSTGLFYATGPGYNGNDDANISQNIYIYGNIFDQGGTTSSWLIAAYNDGSYDFQYASGWKVYNNTFININSVSEWVYAIFLDETGSTNDIKNNIFYGNADGMQIGGGTEDYNSYQGVGDYFNGSHDSLLTNSPFVNYSGGDYRLSAAVSGVALGAPYNVDMLGNTRGADGTWDRGAFEFGGNNSPVIRPNPPILH